MAKFDFVYFSTNDYVNFNELRTFKDFHDYLINFTKINEVILNNLILIDDKDTMRLFKLIKILGDRINEPGYKPDEWDYLVVTHYLYMPFLIDDE